MRSTYKVNMKLIRAICILLLLVSAVQAEDLIFFADDHYKAVGLPLLNASIANPVLGLGDSILTITMANDGRLEELMPISGNGSREDIAKEMAEETHSVDAQSITATLTGAGQISVTSGPQRIESLPSGAVREVTFNLSVADGPGGWISLPLHLDYERQVDVSVSDGEVSPLLLPGNATLSVRVLAPSAGPLRVLGTKSDLFPGKSGYLLLVIKNEGPKDLHNCSASLEAAPPFRSDGKESLLGDMHPGALAVAVFSVSVDGSAALQDFQLGCRVSSEDGLFSLSFPLALGAGEPNYWTTTMLAAVILAGGAGTAFIFMKRKDLLRRRRRRW